MFLAFPHFVHLAVAGTLLGAYLVAESAIAAILLSCLLAYMLAAAILVRMFGGSGARISGVELAWSVLALALLIATVAANARFDDLDGGLQFQLWALLIVSAAWVFYLPSVLTRLIDIKAFIRAFDLFGILISVSVFLPLTGLALGELQGASSGLSRSFGPFGDGVPFAVALFACRAIVARRWLSFGLHLAALMITVGLGASLTLLVALLAHLLLPWRASNARSRDWKTVVLGICAVPLFGMLLLYAGGGIAARIADPSLAAFTLASRFGVFRMAAELIAHHPWLGVGFNGFFTFARQIGAEAFFVGAFDENFIAQAANQTLQTLTDAGIVGLAALGAFLLLAYRSLSWAANYGGVESDAFRGYQIWLVGLVIGNQSAVWLLPLSIVSFVLFVVIGLSVAAGSRTSAFEARWQMAVAT